MRIQDALMTNRPRPFFTILLVGCLAAALGCGESNLAPVRGVVTIDGEPVDSGALFFAPVASGEDKSVGKQSYSKIDADGGFVLGTFQPGDGALVGKHRVSIIDVEHRRGAEDLSFGRLFIPDQFFQIVRGEVNEINLELTAEMIRSNATPPGAGDD